MPALILVDIQNDFMPDGSLPVPDGYEVVPVANQLIKQFDHVIATQDWHPKNHGSFATQHKNHSPGQVIDLFGLPQVLWPEHCVQNTRGAEFVFSLDIDKIDKVIQKGTNVNVDSYSGFADNGGRVHTELHKHLQEKGISKVYICGVATDYCVKFTALDAIGRGYETYLVEDACRGVNLNPGDVDNAVAEMAKEGVIIVSSHDLQV